MPILKLFSIWEKLVNNNKAPVSLLTGAYIYPSMIANYQKRSFLPILFALLCLQACKKDSPAENISNDASLSFTVDGVYNGTLLYTDASVLPLIRFTFTETVSLASANSITWESSSGSKIDFTVKLSNLDRTVELRPVSDLPGFTNFTVTVPSAFKPVTGGKLINPVSIKLVTRFDGKDKFPRISDDELLTLIQRQTFKYFWDFAHPVSGMARERNTSGDIVTSGGTGFGLMGIVTAVYRNFISRAEALTRMQKILSFLKTAQRFHGAYPHWLNGNTGKVQPFSAKDNGADLVETAFLMEGLLVVRQYFDGNSPAETAMRSDITQLYNDVEWDWFRKKSEERLYWHWSPDYNWDINLPVKGWNESLMVYVFGASSSTFGIPKSVYDNGWAGNGSMKNGNNYYGVQLPLGPANGGPLFFEHYSLMALNPMSLTDAYANYETQAVAHTKINYNYCVANPLKYSGYSSECWGLTASDIQSGYAASSPSNDKGYIAPTAAVSSLPYAPEESMRAIRFFYYKLGDKLWGEYGFKDSFSMTDPWFASSYLAIDQGPQIVMIENYRSGLIWKLFMSCPEVRTGLRKLGFQSPNI